MLLKKVNREHKTVCYLWPAYSEDLKIIHRYDNMKDLHLQRNSMGLVSEVKFLEVLASPNGKTFHLDKVCGAKQNINTVVMLNHRNM